MTAETQLQALKEELQWLSFEELRNLAEKSDKLFADAVAVVKARRTPMLVAVSPPPAAVDGPATGEPVEQSTGTDVDDA